MPIRSHAYEKDDEANRFCSDWLTFSSNCWKRIRLACERRGARDVCWGPANLLRSGNRPFNLYRKERINAHHRTKNIDYQLTLSLFVAELNVARPNEVTIDTLIRVEGRVIRVAKSMIKRTVLLDKIEDRACWVLVEDILQDEQLFISDPAAFTSSSSLSFRPSQAVMRDSWSQGLVPCAIERSLYLHQEYE